MNTPALASPGGNKALWATVAVLGVAVLAMGATLLRTPHQPAASDAGVTTAANTVSAPAPAASKAAKLPTAETSASTSTAHPVIKNNTQNWAKAHVNDGQHAAKTVANETFEPMVAQPPTKPLCSNCGIVESVTPVETDGTGSGTGAIAGGVLGAVVGNQMGGGSGKALATILGAVGGGFAGNTVEKKMKKVTHYDVSVRMEDGSRRTVRQATVASVGSQVTVNGNRLQAR